jgi:hypothetical protein
MILITLYFLTNICEGSTVARGSTQNSKYSLEVSPERTIENSVLPRATVLPMKEI